MTEVARIKTEAYQASLLLSQTLSIHHPELINETLPKIISRLSPARHSPDFRSVRWFGKNYAFSPAQALIVEALWNSWRNGTPRMGTRTLLRAANMVSDKISDLFKEHAAWGEAICTDGKGNYWLSELK